MLRITKSCEANIMITNIEDDDILLEQNRQNEDGDDPFEKWYLINPNKTLP
jgi:hypothetical protein